MEHYIKQKEIGEYRITIYPDYDAECPCTNWDMGACYLWEYSDVSQLSKSCNWKECFNNNNHTLEDALRVLVTEYVDQSDLVKYLKEGKLDGWRLIYNRSTRFWELQYRRMAWDKWGRYGKYSDEWDMSSEFDPSDLKKCDVRSELVENFEKDEYIQLLNDLAKAIVFKEWSSTGYSQGDYLEGVAYMTKERFDKMCGFNPGKYKTWQEQAEDVIDGEVKCIEMWAWGDVKGFVLEKKAYYTKVYEESGRDNEDSFDWERVDSCWGYYMETEELINEVISEHGIKEMAA